MADKQDAIALLKADHREVEELFEQFEKATGDGRKQKLAEQIPGQDASQTRTVETEALEGRQVRVRLYVPADAVPGLAEILVTGALRTD